MTNLLSLTRSKNLTMHVLLVVGALAFGVAWRHWLVQGEGSVIGIQQTCGPEFSVVRTSRST